MPAISSSERQAVAMTERATTAHHGLLLTFRRPDDLRHHLDVLAAQAEPLDTLLVVDNDADPAIAADGIDEVMSVGMRFRSSGAPIPYPTGSVALLATDTGHRWSLVAVEGVLGVGRGEAAITATDATMTGPAAGLLLALWGRGGDVDTRGDTSIADRWCAVAP